MADRERTTELLLPPIVIVGGGVVGLSTAYALAKKTVQRILVVEQFGFGHSRGSSHGETRSIRKTYAQAHFQALMDEALEVWADLERDFQNSFFSPGSCCQKAETIFSKSAKELDDVSSLDDVNSNSTATARESSGRGGKLLSGEDTVSTAAAQDRQSAPALIEWTGGFFVGRPEHPGFVRTLQNCYDHNQAVEIFASTGELRKRFGGSCCLKLPGDQTHRAVFAREGGGVIRANLVMEFLLAALRKTQSVELLERCCVDPDSLRTVGNDKVELAIRRCWGPVPVRTGGAGSAQSVEAWWEEQGHVAQPEFTQTIIQAARVVFAVGSWTTRLPKPLAVRPREITVAFWERDMLNDGTHDSFDAEQCCSTSSSSAGSCVPAAGIAPYSGGGHDLLGEEDHLQAECETCRSNPFRAGKFPFFFVHDEEGGAGVFGIKCYHDPALLKICYHDNGWGAESEDNAVAERAERRERALDVVRNRIELFLDGVDFSKVKDKGVCTFRGFRFLSSLLVVLAEVASHVHLSMTQCLCDRICSRGPRPSRGVHIHTDAGRKFHSGFLSGVRPPRGGMRWIERSWLQVRAAARRDPCGNGDGSPARESTRFIAF